MRSIVISTMTRILLSLSLILASVVSLVGGNWVAAEPVLPTVHISLVQAAGSDVKYERIDITNDGVTPADMTGWRLVYTSASGGTATVLTRFQAADRLHLVLDPHDTESIVSKELAAIAPADSPLRSAWQFTAGMSHTAGSVQLLDSAGAPVDMVGWGGTTSKAIGQGDPAPAMTPTSWLRRHSATMNNAADFALEPQTPSIPAVVGSLREVMDVCANLDGLQQAAPAGYGLAADGKCMPLDVCPNVPEVQSDVPEGMEYDSTGECVAIDVCTNLSGVQPSIPMGYELTGVRVCETVIPLRRVLITELLPNPSGADVGNEFIEIYNADSEAADLSQYKLQIGTKSYVFPVGSMLAPGAYWTVSDTEVGASLANTTGSSVYLMTARDVEVASVPPYKNAPDDASWALIGDAWQFSYSPTPGGANIAMPERSCQAGYERDSETLRCKKLAAVTVVTPCADGQYRNEATGRCRNILSMSATLVPCKEGQYRSEETGRCRSLASATSATLKQCADDQFRNPLTNRCKSIASSEDMAVTDCGEGRERNPETHRCRNIVSTTVPAATFAVTPIKEAAKGFVGWWALGGVGVLAASYGAWEWRRELRTIIRGVTARIARK